MDIISSPQQITMLARNCRLMELLKERKGISFDDCQTGEESFKYLLDLMIPEDPNLFELVIYEISKHIDNDLNLVSIFQENRFNILANNISTPSLRPIIFHAYSSISAALYEIPEIMIFYRDPRLFLEIINTLQDADADDEMLEHIFIIIMNSILSSEELKLFYIESKLIDYIIRFNDQTRHYIYIKRIECLTSFFQSPLDTNYSFIIFQELKLLMNSPIDDFVKQVLKGVYLGREQIGQCFVDENFLQYLQNILHTNVLKLQKYALLIIDYVLSQNMSIDITFVESIINLMNRADGESVIIAIDVLTKLILIDPNYCLPLIKSSNIIQNFFSKKYQCKLAIIKFSRFLIENYYDIFTNEIVCDEMIDQFFNFSESENVDALIVIIYILNFYFETKNDNMQIIINNMVNHNMLSTIYTFELPIELQNEVEIFIKIVEEIGIKTQNCDN